MNGTPSSMAYLMTALQPGYEEDLLAGEAAFAAAAVGLNSADESLPYNTAELNAPEYSTDDFRMFSFKVARCSKRYVHDWRACPFAHPTENARRRDPRLHKYLPVPCPEYKRGICFRGDSCPYSHGVYECWLHPAKYRTQLCKEGPHCRRPVCFFAHSVLDLRQPTHVWDGNNYEPQTAAAALMQAAAVAGPQPSASRSSSDGAFSSMLQQQPSQHSSIAVEEALNNANAASDADGSASSGSLSSGGGGGMGPSSPHGSQNGRSDSPAKTNSGNWSPATAGPSYEGGRQVAEASPTTPSRALLDAPARPSDNGALALPPVGSMPSAAETTAAATLAAALADLQAQQRGLAARQGAALPRHSIDVGALAASHSRGSGLAGMGAGSSGTSTSAAQQLLQAQQQARASVDLGQPSASPAAAAQLGAGRMSLDSLMATRNAGSQAPWANSLAGVPEVSQNSHGPRMSNAVARKLGLAPQRTANEARLAKLRGAGAGGLATPPRTSLDGLLQALHGSQRASLEQQMVSQQMLAAAGLAQMNGGYMAPSGFPQQPGSYPGAMPDPSAMGINPALLNMVAAQMGGAVPGPMPGQVPSMAQQQQNAAAMAALVDSLNGWSLNGGQQAGYHGGPSGLPHRAASFDGAMSAHAAMMAQQGAPATSPYYLPAELENLMNNNSGGQGDGLVNPVAAGHGARGRE